jgi:hypothetical protein
LRQEVVALFIRGGKGIVNAIWAEMALKYTPDQSRGADDLCAPDRGRLCYHEEASDTAGQHAPVHEILTDRSLRQGMNGAVGGYRREPCFRFV